MNYLLNDRCKLETSLNCTANISPQFLIQYLSNENVSDVGTFNLNLLTLFLLLLKKAMRTGLKLFESER